MRLGYFLRHLGARQNNTVPVVVAGSAECLPQGDKAMTRLGLSAVINGRKGPLVF